MFVMPTAPVARATRARKSAPFKLVRVATGMALAEADITDKYTVNINRDIDGYIRDGYCHLVLHRVPNRTTGGMDLHATLSSTASPLSRRLTFKHGNRGGSNINDEHPRYLTALGLRDCDAYKMVNAQLVGGTYYFKLVPYNADCGIVTSEPVLTVSAPRLGNRTQAVALQQLATRTMQSAYREYRRDVSNRMDECERKHGHRFGNQHLRGKPGVSRDHMYTVKDAFLNGVQPHVVAHWSNIQYLSVGDNSSKGAHSSRSIYQLYAGYGEAESCMEHAFQLMDSRKR